MLTKKNKKTQHARNIVHRGIRPENILLVDKYSLQVKLSDFRLAIVIGEEGFETDIICGTQSYVAPEILAEAPHRRYTKAVDISYMVPWRSTIHLPMWLPAIFG